MRGTHGRKNDKNYYELEKFFRGRTDGVVFVLFRVSEFRLIEKCEFALNSIQLGSTKAGERPRMSSFSRVPFIDHLIAADSDRYRASDSPSVVRSNGFERACRRYESPLIAPDTKYAYYSACCVFHRPLPSRITRSTSTPYGRKAQGDRTSTRSQPLSICDLISTHHPCRGSIKMPF